MAQFINAKEDIVQEAIDGVISASGGRLARLDGYPYIRVVLRSEWDDSKVAILSGGGSGHEPAHAGFVGKGMLTAAVCGDVFASPSVDAVLAGIRAVTGAAGCLLIVKNYTGDRLNFGLAAARARELGLTVNMVVVEDDIALPDIARPRGIAGTLFVHKVAGAVAEAGGDLDAVTQAAIEAARGAVSIGMSLSSCTVPGSPPEDRIAEGSMEVGLGIHGEPGAEQLRFETATRAIDRLVARLEPHLSERHYAVLVNNLGATTALEMSIMTEALRRSSIGAKLRHIIGPAPMMTALDMHGVSLSLLPVSPETLGLLGAETDAPAWPGLHDFAAPRTVAMPETQAATAPPPSHHDQHAAILRETCAALLAAEADLNALDAKSGDGDTGSTVAGAARALSAQINALPLADLGQLFPAISRSLTQTMGGSSGVILAIFFSAAGEAMAGGASAAQALQAGLRRVEDVGGAQRGDRTMIDALSPALDALPKGLSAAAQAARNGADETARLERARAGRATYVNADLLRGHPDPGAEAVARVFERLAANLG
ncbi:MAG: dihydroxyacetone kinase subunit DhaK [Pseudomonadota bacterium]